VSSYDREDWRGETIVVGSDTETVGELVGSGREGDVYRIEGSPEEVVKLFSPDRRAQKEAKVRSMIGEKPTDRTYKRKGVRSIIWPEAVATETSSSAFLGYQMPYKDLESATPAFEYSVVDLSWEASDIEDRFKAARNLAIMVRNIHRAGHAMGDFNDKNILIDDGYVTLIDCDAFHVSDGDTIYGDSTYHPRYSPPQKRGHSLTAVQEADKFCLGVHLFQFLLEGAHPYQAVGDEAANGDWADKIQGNPFPYEDTESDVRPGNGMQDKYDKLPSEMRALFEECFGTGSKSLTWGRPAPIEWIRTIGELTGSRYDLQFSDSELPIGGDSEPGTGNSTGDGLTVPAFGKPSGNGTSGRDESGSDDGLSVPDFGHSTRGTGQARDADSDEDDVTVPDFGKSTTSHDQSAAEGDTADLDVPEFGSADDERSDTTS
jgi:DNA-binding helix-hairpin-helix protein with protein kinase domain